MQERDLSAEDVVAIFLDGKMFADATMVVALGITITGDKRFLGFVETSTENEQVLTPFLRSLWRLKLKPVANPWSNAGTNTESQQSPATGMTASVDEHLPNLRSWHSPQGPILIENKFSIIC